jgi:hypothetical protein
MNEAESIESRDLLPDFWSKKLDLRETLLSNSYCVLWVSGDVGWLSNAQAQDQKILPVRNGWDKYVDLL